MNASKGQLGNITKQPDGFKVVFERVFNHNIQQVWGAITNPEKLKIWFTDFEMKLEPKSKINIIFRDKAKTVTTGEVLEVVPPHKFVWTWEGELAVWELESKGENKCKVTFTYSKLTDQYAVGASAGFHSLIERLEFMLNGKKETYPFGTEEHDPEQEALREVYGKTVYDTFPELEAHHPFKLERVLSAPVTKVWHALTDNEALKQWYFDFKGNFKLKVGHVFEWKAGPPDGKQWLHRGKIIEVVAGKKIVHSWDFPGYSGEAKLTWELEEKSNNETLLKLLFEFITPFDFKEEELRRKNFAEGWNNIVNTNLVNYLKK
jgi:uncharacterized protein YndB with AHSA1/START domain